MCSDVQCSGFVSCVRVFLVYVLTYQCPLIRFMYPLLCVSLTLLIRCVFFAVSMYVT